MTDNNDVTQERVKLTAKTTYEKAKVIYGEIGMLSEDIKELKAQAKEDGVDNLTEVFNVAKADAECKLDEKENKAQTFLSVVEELKG